MTLSCGLADERRKTFVAVEDRAVVGERDRPFLHLLDQHAIGTVGVFERVDLLPVGPPTTTASTSPLRIASSVSSASRRRELSSSPVSDRVIRLGRDCVRHRILQPLGLTGVRFRPARTLSLSDRSPMIRRKGSGRILTRVGVAMICSSRVASGLLIHVDDFEIVSAVEILLADPAHVGDGTGRARRRAGHEKAQLVVSGWAVRGLVGHVDARSDRPHVEPDETFSKSDRSPIIRLSGGGSRRTSVGTATIWSPAASCGVTIRSMTSIV